MSDKQNELVAHKLKKGNIALESAKLLAKARDWNGCVNWLYYGCFYLVSALLQTRQMDSKTYTGTKTLFFINFINTGILDKKWSKVYTALFNTRQEGDYDDFKIFTEEEVKSLISEADSFSEAIRNLITGKSDSKK